AGPEGGSPEPHPPRHRDGRSGSGSEAPGSAGRPADRAREDLVGAGGAHRAALLRHQSAARATEGDHKRVAVTYPCRMRFRVAALLIAAPALAAPDPAAV